MRLSGSVHVEASVSIIWTFLHMRLKNLDIGVKFKRTKKDKILSIEIGITMSVLKFQNKLSLKLVEGNKGKGFFKNRFNSTQLKLRTPWERGWKLSKQLN